jgi:hypothetical protein
MHVKKYPRNSYIFRLQGNLLHFEDILHKLCFIFLVYPVYFIIVSFSVHITLKLFINNAPKIKYQLGHLMVKSGHQEIYDSEFWLMKANGGIILILFLCFCILK